ncbi:MAG: tRNA (adenosine(37)-N6)-threonylcarbamoyltransferase complex ATPase subunit type 1 TsaE [Treponema sp.]|nr:tRNA (adenosine(37)-N6)-threonylcarbamoyltransferase complex ATPase subunit type 1 TsaE [Treponema sp.]
MIKITSLSPYETTTLGEKLAVRLFAGSVVALNGTLGSGKTCLVKGIAKGLGITENITSPTFTIINEYLRDNSPALYHIDAYRLNSSRDFEDIGGLEIIGSDNICLIEWSERISKSIPGNAIIVTLEITGPSSRLILINGLEKL